MGKVLQSLVFATAVLGALTAILLNGLIVAVVPLVGIVAAVWFFLLRHRSGYIAGSVLLVFCIAALVMSLGNISFRGGAGVGDADVTAGHATAVASAVVAGGALLGVAWGRLQPAWMPYAWLVVALVALGVAYGLGESLGNPVDPMSYVVGVLVLLAGAPALVMLVRGEDAA